MDTRSALLVLNMLPLVGPGRKRLLTAAFGSPEAALQASVEQLARVPGIGAKIAPILHSWQRYCQLDEELRMVQQAGVHLVFEEDDCYPPLLREIHDPPICLYVKGSLEALKRCDCAIAMVGSRNATPYGVRMASRLAQGASQAGWPVVSGLARGIDTAAHQATLHAGGCTIAVIGSGMTRVYPPENIPLAASICQSGGAVVTEYPMRYCPDKRSFPMRNRIISGMTRGTIVVEAGLKSGSLITASTAMDQNRTVFAVPGIADGPFSKGCHALIRDGAVLVEEFQDVIDDFTGLPGLASPPAESQARPLPPPDLKALALSPLEERLLELLRKGVNDIDDLIAVSEEPSPCVTASLLNMQLKRILRQLPGRKVQLLT